MDYQNRLSAFENSVEENNRETSNYISKKNSAISTNKTLLSTAKSLASAKITADEMRGISIEGGIRLVKPLAQKGLSWADKKFMNGKIERETKNFGDWAKNAGKDKLSNIKNSMKETWERNKPTPEDSNPAQESSQGIGDRKPTEATDEAPRSRPGDIEMTDRGESKFKDMKDYGKETEMQDMTESGTYAKMPEKGTASYDEVPDWAKGNDLGYRDSGVEESKTAEPEDSSSKVTDTEGGESGATEEVSTDAGGTMVKMPETGGETGGTMVKMPEKSIGEDDVADVAKTGASEGTDEAVGEGLEVAGTAADATGIGAVIGIPLQVAGLVLEGAGVYEAGKSIVDWFKDDVLGDKPKINAPTVALPHALSTLAGKGLEATPTFDTTMDVGGGVGGW